MAIDGPRLFEGKPDMDTASEVTHALAEITQTDLKDKDIFESPEVAWLGYFDMGFATDSDPDMDAATVCEHIDSGAGDELFKRYRAKEDKRKIWGAYSRHETIILGAMMMRVGAKIKKEDLAHLRRLSVRSDNEMFPEGLAEFQAAIDHYKPGTPRTFGGPSCDTCGKTALDIDKKLSVCKRCMSGDWTGGWSCSKTCQQAHRNKHKRAARAHDKCVKEQEAKEAKNNEAKKVKAVEQGAGESKDSSS